MASNVILTATTIPWFVITSFRGAAVPAAMTVLSLKDRSILCLTSTVQATGHVMCVPELSKHRLIVLKLVRRHTTKELFITASQVRKNFSFFFENCLRMLFFFSEFCARRMHYVFINLLTIICKPCSLTILYPIDWKQPFQNISVYWDEDLPEAMNDREKWRERVRDIRAGGATWWWWWWLRYMVKLT